MYINIGIDATITIKVLFSSGWLVPSGAGPESEQVSLEKLFLVVVCVMEENVTFVLFDDRLFLCQKNDDEIVKSYL